MAAECYLIGLSIRGMRRNNDGLSMTAGTLLELSLLLNEAQIEFGLRGSLLNTYIHSSILVT